MAATDRIENVVNGTGEFAGYEPVMCMRCSNPAVVVLAVDIVEDPAAEYVVHHATRIWVCDEHVPAGVAVILDALNARPGNVAP